MDFDANWKWGKYFYNVSYAVSTISGCHLDANNNLVALGVGDSHPVIMEVDLIDGEVISFLSLDKITDGGRREAAFQTYGAIYHDTQDEDDGLAYYYVSFVVDDYMQILKIETAEARIEWNYQYYRSTDGSDAEAYKNWKVPGFLHQSRGDTSRMYLLGRFAHAASVIQFSKRNMKVDWKLEIGEPLATGVDLP